MGVETKYETLTFTGFERRILKKDGNLGSREERCQKLLRNECPDPEKKCGLCPFARVDHRKLREYLEKRKFEEVKTTYKSNHLGLCIATRGYFPGSHNYVEWKHIPQKGNLAVSRGSELRY